MQHNAFDVVKSKRNESLVNYEDYDLVKFTQRDVDEYREKCNWICYKCGYKISYYISLLMLGKDYIHEMKCPNESKKGKVFIGCRSKMTLARDDEAPFDSIYFNELFARYQDRIIWESMKSFSVDSPDEVYSTLMSSFLKIVLQFARDKRFKSSSDKWFSSFFWKSVQNKIADLQKTNTYNKRCPTVKCAICGDNVGQITSRHLSLPGHEDLIKYMLIRHGRFSMESSGEIECYKHYRDRENIIEKRSLLIGERKFNKKTKKEKKKMFDSECLDIYSIMFPNALFKNNVSSINSTINEENETELIEFFNESVLCEQKSCIEEIEMNSNIYLLADIVVNSIDSELKEFLKIKINNKELKEIIYKVLYLKSTFIEDFENFKVDSMVDGIKRGFTSRLLGIIRLNDECRISMGVRSCSDNFVEV